VALRAVLLLVGGCFMLWRAWEANRAALAESAADAVLLRRMALVEGLVGVLALGAAVVAALALRPRRRRRTLDLGDPGRRGGDDPLRGDQ
jgi:hypothetical protein